MAQNELGDSGELNQWTSVRCVQRFTDDKTAEEAEDESRSERRCTQTARCDLDFRKFGVLDGVCRLWAVRRVGLVVVSQPTSPISYVVFTPSDECSFINTERAKITISVFCILFNESDSYRRCVRESICQTNPHVWKVLHFRSWFGFFSQNTFKMVKYFN